MLNIVGCKIKVRQSYGSRYDTSENGMKLIGKKGIVLATTKEGNALVRFKKNWNGVLHKGDGEPVYAKDALCWFIRETDLKVLNKPVVDVSIYVEKE